MCVTSLPCGPWADLRPFNSCTVNGFLSTYKGLPSEAARQIHRRKTAVNSLQRLQLPPKFRLGTRDSSAFHSSSCFKMPLH